MLLVDGRRLVTNYVALNKFVAPTAQTVEDLTTMLDKIAAKRSQYFAVVDLASGYNQMRLAPDAQRYLAVQTPLGPFVPTTLPMGVRSAVGTFHNSVLFALSPILDHILVRIDDIACHELTLEALATRFIELLCILKQWNLKIGVNKLQFGRRSMGFLGYRIDGSGYRLKEETIAPLVDSSPPTTAAGLQSGLAGLNWGRGGIPRFAELAQPLYDILAHAVSKYSARPKALANVSLPDVGWTAEQSERWHLLTKLFGENIKRAHRNPLFQLLMCTDASDRFWSVVVAQVHPDQLSRDIWDMDVEILALANGPFKGSQLNWPMVDKELFAIVQGILRYRYLMEPGNSPPLFATDHANLLGLLTSLSTSTPRHTVIRRHGWEELLSSIDFRVLHVPGERNWLADFLSREGVTPAIRAEAQEHLKAWLELELQRRTVAAQQPNTASSVTVSPIRVGEHAADAMGLTPEDAPSEAELRLAQSALLPAEREGLLNADGLWCSPEGQIVVPDVRNLRMRILVAAHQGLGAHRATDVTKAAVERLFTWPSLRSDTSNFVRDCTACLTCRNGKHIQRSWGDILRAKQPFQIVHCDHTHIRAATPDTPGEYSGAYVLTDNYSKWSRIYPTASANADAAVRAVLDWIAVHGMFDILVSDGGPELTGSVLEGVLQTFGIQHHITTAYNPRGNGLIERRNRELREVLSALCAEHKIDGQLWPVLIPAVQLALNQSPSRILGGLSPFELVYGRKPPSHLQYMFYPQLPELADKPPSAEAFKRHLADLQVAIQDNIHRVDAVPRRKARDPPGAKPIDFDVGDYVLMASVGSQTKDKTAPIWHGPARVVDRVNDKVFLVQNLTQPDAKPVQMHARDLKRYADRLLTVTPQLMAFAGYTGRGWTLELFRSHRYNKRGAVELEAQWEGFIETSWEPLDTMVQDAVVLVKRYVSSVVDSKERKKLQDAMAKLPRRRR